MRPSWKPDPAYVPGDWYNPYAMAKLTLSVDAAVVARAKRYAKQSGVSLSAMIEAYLVSVSALSPAQELPPVLRSLHGILKKGDPEDYKKHLAEKYL
jgi:hypothetical protein